WDDAAPSLDVHAEDITDYRAALAERFANPRMRDVLAPLAAARSQQLPVRHVPVLRTERSTGRMPPGAVAAVAAWVAHLRGAGVPVNDVAAEQWQLLAAGEDNRAVRTLLTELAPGLAEDTELRAAVLDRLRFFESVKAR